MIQCAARETEDLEEAFALIIRDGTFLVAVRRGLISTEDVALLDRLIKRGLAELMTKSLLAVTA